MNADIRAISLYRRPISPEHSTAETKTESDNQTKTDTPLEHNAPTNNVSSPNNIKEYFITDYFDIMHVRKVSPASSLSDILNIKKKDAQMPNLAVQSYTMYFSEQMQAEYEGINNSSSKYRENPFNTGESDFLSIIQVHISPEVLSRIEDNNSNGNIIIKPFIDDIYSILDLFYKECSSDFTAKV